MAAEHARAMTGHYIASDRSASNFLAINSFRFPTVVEINDEGQLVISSLTGADGAPKRGREVAPFLWHEVGGNDRLAAKLVDGKPVRFANDEYAPLVVWDRQPRWRSTADRKRVGSEQSVAVRVDHGGRCQLKNKQSPPTYDK